MNHFHGPATIHYHVQTLHQSAGFNPGQLMAIPLPGVLPLAMPLFSLSPAAGSTPQFRDPLVLSYGTNGVLAPAATHHPSTWAHSLVTMELMEARLSDSTEVSSRLALPNLPPLHPQCFGLQGLVVSLCVGNATVKPPPIYVLDSPRRLIAEWSLPRAVKVEAVPEVYLWQLVRDLYQQRQLAARWFHRMEPEGRKSLVLIFKQTSLPTLASWQLLWEAVPVDMLRGMVLS